MDTKENCGSQIGEIEYQCEVGSGLLKLALHQH